MTYQLFRFLIPALLIFSGLFSTTQFAIASIQTETSQITPVVVQALTSPDQPANANPRVTHVVVVGNYALADWLLGEGGGEMLLTKKENVWQSVSGGGGAMDSSNLIELGVPADTATQLIQQLQAQWRK